MSARSLSLVSLAPRKPCGVMIAVLLFTLLGCGGEDVGPKTDERGFAVSLGLDWNDMTDGPNGLYFQSVAAGDGREAASGVHVFVHYTGWLEDGRKFDSSRDRGEPFDFDLGAGQVIAGWDQGVSGMKVGERRMLVIPPDLGYGAAGAGGGVIPPNATLVFDVELLDIR